MTIDHEQPTIPVEAPDSWLPSVIGASRTGARVGGGLMLLLVILEILSIAITRQRLFGFGSLPGISTYLSICNSNYPCATDSLDTLFWIALIFTTLVWLALGVMILIGAEHHLTKVTMAGLCAIGLFQTVPNLEGTIWTMSQSIRYYSPLTILLWPLFVAVPLLALTALLLMVLASRRGQSKSKLLFVWAIVLLSVGVFLQAANSIDSILRMPRSFLLFDLLPVIFLAATYVPWIIVAATARPQPATMSITPAAILATS